MSECVSCGHHMAPNARFCIKCGMAVSDGATSVVSGRFDATSGTSQVQLLDALREATLGEYEILTELGRGGMAVVYLAHDLALDRKVAIKVMSPELLLMGEQVVERFNREARTAAKLSHPHVIPIYTVKETPELAYFVMKFIQGRSLESVMRGEDRLPTGVVQTILSQVGSALDYAHRNGVIHRDIKPGNVMLDEEGWAVVTDFGIAKAVEAEGLTMTGAAIGTPSYMSPEQCSGLTVTGAADQYSLGVLAYEMLSGKLPFEGDSAMTVMFRHTHEAPPHITEAWPDCPPELGAAVMRMLAKKPADRWPSVEAATSAIAAVQPLTESSVRTQMVTMVKRASNQSLLAQFRTPRTPVPSTARTAGSRNAPAAASAAGEITPDTSPVAAAAQPGETAAPRRSRIWLVAVPVIVSAMAAGWLLFPGGETSVPSTPPVAEPAPGSPAPPAIASLEVTPGAATLEVGDTAPLMAIARDSAGEPLADAEILWSTSDPAVVRVGPDGAITALAAGFARVTARTVGHSATVGITVSSPTALATPAVEETRAAVAAVTATPSTATVVVGERVTLQAAALDAEGRSLADRETAWRSSDPTVATVSAAGEVRGLRPGRVDIIATIEGRTARVPLTVTPVPVASIRLTPTTLTLQVGETAQLTAATFAADGAALTGRSVTWRTTGDAVQVSSTGQITAVAPGSVTVTATSESRSATATVTVAAPVRAEPQAVPPDEATDRERVTATLEAYARALESRDLDQLRRAYPGLTDEQAAAWRTFFQNVSDLHVTLSITSIRIDGDVATAAVDAVQEFHTNRSERRSFSFTAILERAAAGWRLMQVH